METTLTQNWIPTADPFGARLALIRQKMQWNLKEASTECGFAVNQWASWETGRMPRDYQDVCEKIAKRTGVDVVWLMLGAERRPSDYKAMDVRTLTAPSKRPPRGPRPMSPVSRKGGSTHPKMRR